MSPLPLDLITDAVQSLRQYHVRLAYHPGIVYEGEIDLVEGRQYLVLGLSPGDFPAAEVFWQDQQGYGRRLDSASWLKLRGGPFPNYLQHALDLLQDAWIIATQEGEFSWRVELEPDQFPARDDPEAFYKDIFGDPPDPETRAAIGRMVDLSRKLQAHVEMTVSREDFLISQVILRVAADDVASELRLDFGPSQAAVPPLPAEVPDLVLPDLQVHPETLLCHLPTIGGWDCYQSHGPWAQRAIQLIQDEESGLPPDQRKYVEIYHVGGKDDFSKEPFDKLVDNEPDPKRHHPIVLGVWHEDSSGAKDAAGQDTRGMPLFYDDWFGGDPRYQADPAFFYSLTPYNRAFNHFGGDGEGLEYHDYFMFAHPPGTQTKNVAGKGSYYSARDWGYGLDRLKGKGGEAMNRLTFTRAIEQYHRYTWEGKRNAYLMLGHVTHLLQDVGMPDHAKLVAHAGSGYTEKEMYKITHYCEILAAEIAAAACPACWLACLWCAAGAFAVAEAACWGGADEDEMGYEKLIAEKWDVAALENVIQNAGIQHEPDYDAYFHMISEIAQNAVAEVKQQYPGANLDSALGCGSLKVLPPIPGGDPDIDSSNPVETQPFFELTNKIVPSVISLSAGLIQDFYAIVNYPPFVQRVAIVQWEPNAQPIGFARLAADQGPCLRYDAEWQMMDPDLRKWAPHKKQQLSPDRPAYIFVLFGPADVAPAEGRAMAEAYLNVTGKYPPTAEIMDTAVQLHLDHDDEVGYYYWGVYYPQNCGADPYPVTLEIRGKDLGPHYALRQPSGEELDAQPDTRPTADIYCPNFPWINYTPDVDKHHQVTIARFAWELAADPQPLVIRPAQEPRGRVQLRIHQQAWNCTWEPFWGPMNCPVEWELADKVTLLGNPPQHDKPSHFFFRTKLEPERGGAILEVTVNPEHYIPGSYLIEVYHTVGDPPNKHTVTVQMEII